MSTKKKRGRELELLVEALDDVPLDDDAVREANEKLGGDIGAFADKVRGMIADADARDRAARFQEARRSYAADLERFERRRLTPRGDRAEREATFRALIAKAPREAAVAMHFHKYESATDEELDELIRALRHLLGEDEAS
jgi:hypothetical protein